MQESKLVKYVTRPLIAPRCLYKTENLASQARRCRHSHCCGICHVCHWCIRHWCHWCDIVHFNSASAVDRDTMLMPLQISTNSPCHIISPTASSQHQIRSTETTSEVQPIMRQIAAITDDKCIALPAACLTWLSSMVSIHFVWGQMLSVVGVTDEGSTFVSGLAVSKYFRPCTSKCSQGSKHRSRQRLYTNDCLNKAGMCKLFRMQSNATF